MITALQYAAAYEKYFIYTQRWIRSLGCPEGLVEEIAQAAWVRGWERRAQLEEPGAVCFWVGSIAKNMLHRLMRSNGAYKRTESFINEMATGLVVNTLSSVEAALDVEKLLSYCTDPNKQAVEEELIGDRKNTATWRVRLNRGRLTMRAAAGLPLPAYFYVSKSKFAKTGVAA